MAACGDSVVLSSKFVFDDELVVEDDFETINGYLWALDYLVDRLDSSQEMDNINFYADYNVLTGAVKLTSSYYTPVEDSELNKIVDVFLSEQEKTELVEVMESYCKSKYRQSCLEFVNEVREQQGLEPLSGVRADSLADRISSADKIRNLQQSERSGFGGRTQSSTTRE